jgi:hypothetical protein
VQNNISAVERCSRSSSIWRREKAVQSVERVRQRIHEWLVKHELDRDTRFYTREEWTARKEPYLADPELVLTFEGALYRVVNGCDRDSIKLYGQLERLARRLGFYFEIGHAWNMGFYPIPAKRLHPDLRICSEQA